MCPASCFCPVVNINIRYPCVIHIWRKQASTPISPLAHANLTNHLEKYEICFCLEAQKDKSDAPLTLYPHWHFTTHSISMYLFSMWICRELRSSWSKGSIELLSHKSYPYSTKSNRLPEFRGHNNSTCEGDINKLLAINRTDSELSWGAMTHLYSWWY